MAIESPRIVAGSTVPREESYVNCVPLYRAIPIAGVLVYTWNNLTNTWETILPDVPVEGQLAVVDPDSGFIASLHCYRSGQWVTVSINSEPIDASTGKTWDPLAQFYTPLAS